MAPKPDDLRSTFKGTKHDHNPPIVRLKKVADGLIPATSKVMIPERLLVDHAKVLASLGRDVDMSSRRQRCCGDPEDLLFADPSNQTLWDGFVEDAHRVQNGIRFEMR